jgi:hypothetical protein
MAQPLVGPYDDYQRVTGAYVNVGGGGFFLFLPDATRPKYLEKTPRMTHG